MNIKNKLVEFLKQDLKEIEENNDIMKHDMMQNFVSYWRQHSEKLKD